MSEPMIGGLHPFSCICPICKTSTFMSRAEWFAKQLEIELDKVNDELKKIKEAK